MALLEEKGYIQNLHKSLTQATGLLLFNGHAPVKQPHIAIRVLHCSLNHSTAKMASTGHLCHSASCLFAKEKKEALLSQHTRA